MYTTTAILIAVGAAGVTFTVARSLYGLLIARRGFLGRLFVAVAGVGYGLPLALEGHIAGYVLAVLGVAAASAAVTAVFAAHARGATRLRSLTRPEAPSALPPPEAART